MKRKRRKSIIALFGMLFSIGLIQSCSDRAIDKGNKQNELNYPINSDFNGK
jgi:hypothetical protein